MPTDPPAPDDLPEGFRLPKPEELDAFREFAAVLPLKLTHGADGEPLPSPAPLPPEL